MNHCVNLYILTYWIEGLSFYCTYDYLMDNTNRYSALCESKGSIQQTKKYCKCWMHVKCHNTLPFFTSQLLRGWHFLIGDFFNTKFFLSYGFKADCQS